MTTTRRTTALGVVGLLAAGMALAGGAPASAATYPPRPPLPLQVKSNKKVENVPGEFVPLVKSSKTNKDGVIKRRVSCRPLLTSAAGEVSFCKVRVTRKGGVSVKVQGYQKVKVTVRMAAKPKAGKKADWRTSFYKHSWILSGNKFRKSSSAASSPALVFGLAGASA